MSYISLEEHEMKHQEKILKDLAILHKAKAILTSRINIHDSKCVFRSAITSDRISECITTLEDELI
jgi:ABC-type uncharacterized transport system ATPase subunit|tara:strand:- start:1098 stop:1295 length:198 start_codon:yes stop_codon:yes gene_type:complete